MGNAQLGLFFKSAFIACISEVKAVSANTATHGVCHCVAVCIAEGHGKGTKAHVQPVQACTGMAR